MFILQYQEQMEVFSIIFVLFFLLIEALDRFTGENLFNIKKLFWLILSIEENKLFMNKKITKLKKQINVDK